MLCPHLRSAVPHLAPTPLETAAANSAIGFIHRRLSHCTMAAPGYHKSLMVELVNRIPKRSRRTWRDRLRFMIHQRASPEAIARGLAIGLVITFTPTVGIQIPLAILFATLFNANRLSAVLPVWLTNVLTVPPTYAFTYWVGSHFIRTSAKTPMQLMQTLTKRMSRHEFYLLHRHFKEFFELGREVFLPMMVGGLLVGGTVGLISYPITLRIIRHHRARRKARLQRRAVVDSNPAAPGPPASSPLQEP